MNLCLFFEGTGRGVAGKITNGESSNLWGALDRVHRNFPRIRLHFACKGL